MNPQESSFAKKLSELRVGEKGRIQRVFEADAPEMTRRLLEMGLLEGSPIEVLHEAPFGRDPIAVRVRGGLIALRREEAKWVEVNLERNRIPLGEALE